MSTTPRSSTPSGKGPRVTATNADKMHVDALHVVVRPNNPTSGLEGAFRVHVLPESLISAGLRVGDICEIACEDGTNGYGIAWRADDRYVTSHDAESTSVQITLTSRLSE